MVEFRVFKCEINLAFCVFQLVGLLVPFKAHLDGLTAIPVGFCLITTISMQSIHHSS